MAMIATAADPVPLRGDALDEIWWQGRQWAVTAYGLERRDGTYPIEASRLYERHRGDDGRVVWCWPIHMAGKCWIDITDFCTAFAVALALHPRPAKVKPFRRGEVRQACADAIETVERYRRAHEAERAGKDPSIVRIVAAGA